MADIFRNTPPSQRTESTSNEDFKELSAAQRDLDSRILAAVESNKKYKRKLTALELLQQTFSLIEATKRNNFPEEETDALCHKMLEYLKALSTDEESYAEAKRYCILKRWNIRQNF
jgi:hypothetical protein